jgi:hypothetical protein
LDVNFKYKKKSVKAQSIQDYTISGIRETAKNLGLFDNSKRLVNLSTSSSKDSFSSTLEEN